MHAQEFYYACEEFKSFGKIKDIDFDRWLFHEPISNLVIKEIDFEKGIVKLGEWVDFGCECCGGYYETTSYNLDELASEGYLGMVLDCLGEVLNRKVGV